MVNNMNHEQLNQRRLPGILAALPASLPFHPYSNDYSGHQRHQHMYKHQRRRRRGRAELERHEDPGAGLLDEPILSTDCASSMIPDMNLYPSIPNARNGETFTLFFFVDCTNRQSLLAISVVSKWFQYALNKKDTAQNQSGNIVICIPNHPKSAQNESILLHSGFYELPFHHPKRLVLLHLLNASRVPSILVVENSNGKILTQFGWEAIEREGYDGGKLDNWIERQLLERKKCWDDSSCDGTDDNNRTSSRLFDSQVVKAWRRGRSGLPCWWHLLSWFF
jgi:hypothetical protein